MVHRGLTGIVHSPPLRRSVTGGAITQVVKDGFTTEGTGSTEQNRLPARTVPSVIKMLLILVWDRAATGRSEGTPAGRPGG